jgi:chromosomal replication initiator protein
MSIYRAVEAYINIRAISNDSCNDIITVYGGKNTGKTKLLHSVKQTVSDVHPEMKIKYMTTLDFIHELVQAVYDNKLPEYVAECRQIDLMLLDDLQDISGKIALEHELMNIFNALIQEHKQVVVTLDRPVKEVSHLDRNIKKVLENGAVLKLN